MPPINILIMIHGITPDPAPKTHQADYDAMLAGLFRKAPALQKAFAKKVFVEWGHRPPTVPPAAARDDQKIMDAENTIHSLVSYDALTSNPHPLEHLLGPFTDIPARVISVVTEPIKEKLSLLGITDAFYYVSQGGEESVRAVVYHVVLEALRDFKEEPDVRLHVIGHSLGVTIAHDFLFGLFAPDDQLTGGKPGYLDNSQASKADKQDYLFWREKAGNSLTLGSKASTAGQLPLMMMRKQRLVDRLAQGQPLDPTVIGIPREGNAKWRMFFVLIDVLGFPARRLYDPVPTIEEFQVDNGANPAEVHSLYWTNDTVLTQVADLLQRNLM
jgi:hypothetical protein